jgi:hypothetical protein
MLWGIILFLLSLGLVLFIFLLFLADNTHTVIFRRLISISHKVQIG